MDVNDLRIGVTLLSLAAFVGITAWAWSSRQAARFDEASRLPFVAEAQTADELSRQPGTRPARPLP